jgi:hypothetical protein
VDVRPIDASGNLRWSGQRQMISGTNANWGARITEPSYAMVLSGGVPKLQRFDLVSGQPGDVTPLPLAAADNPSDQGGFVLLKWDASHLDSRFFPVVPDYGIWRSPAGMNTWSEVGTTPAISAQRYSALAPAIDETAYDWKVRVNSTDPNVFWESVVASATSTDNLPPAAPSSLVAQRNPDGVSLSWSPGDDDAERFAVFRGASAGFVANDDARIATVTETTFIDRSASADEAFYVVAAIDPAGHMSSLSDEVAAAAAPVASTPALARLTVRSNAPNPFANATALRIGLPAAGTATVEVFDVAGRRVASRQVAVNAGWNEIAFDGRDDAGRALASGVYFYRVRAAAETITRKFVIQR